MKRVLVPCLFALALGWVCVAQSASCAEATPVDAKKLVGVWKGGVVSGTGEQAGQFRTKLELTIDEKEIKGLEFKNEKPVDHGKGAYTLNAQTNPPTLDALQVNERGRKTNFQGLFSLEGDTIKWCVGRDKRPTEFKTGDGCFLVIVKRAAP